MAGEWTDEQVEAAAQNRIIINKAERALSLLQLAEPRGADWSGLVADIRAAVALAQRFDAIAIGARKMAQRSIQDAQNAERDAATLHEAAGKLEGPSSP